MTTYVVGAGQVFTSNLGPGDSATVKSGGETLNISDGGHELVALGGLASGTTVLNGGFLVLSAGAAGSGDMVASGGTLSGAGALFGVNIDSGLVSGVRVASAAAGQPAGYLEIDAGGVASNVSVYGSLHVVDGSAVSVTDAGFVSVNQGGGTAIATMIVAGPGPDPSQLQNEGITSGSVIRGAGQFEETEAGGESVGETVSSGGSALVDADGLASGTLVSSGGTEIVLVGGVVSGATVIAGGILSGGGALLGNVYDSGLVSGVQVGLSNVENSVQDGSLTVGSGGVASSVLDLYGSMTVAQGGSAVGVTDEYVVNVDSGGTATGTKIIAGPTSPNYLFNYGVTTGSVIEGAGQEEETASGGQSLGELVSGGGSALVDSGGLAGGTLVSSGGTEIVLVGGVVSDATVVAGGILSGGGVLLGDVYDSGLVSGVQVGLSNASQGEQDGYLFIQSGIASGVLDTYGAVYVSAGGSAVDVTDEERVVVSPGGTATGTIFLSTGGFAILINSGVTTGSVIEGVNHSEVTESGGQSLGETVSSGGSALVDSGGLAGGTLVSSGGTEIVSAGGVASGATVQSAGVLSGAGVLVGSVYDSGLVSGVQVGLSNASGVQFGRLEVDSGGVASGVRALFGYVFVEAGGSAVNATDAYAIVVYSGGTASGTMVVSGPASPNILLNSGVTTGSVIQGAGQYEETASGGQSLGETVSSGGSALIDSGGLAGGTVVSSGGTEIVSAGGVVSDATVVAGGILSGGGALLGDVYDSGLVSGVQVGPSNGAFPYGFLEVDFGGVASGVLDLYGDVYVEPGGSAVNCTDEYTILVDPGGTASGTMIVSGPTGPNYLFNYGVTTGSVIEGAGQDEETESGGQSLGEIVSSGGSALVDSGGMAGGAIVSSGGTEIVSAGGVVSGATVVSGGTLSGAGVLKGAVIDRGLVSGALLLEGSLTVSSGGVASGAIVLGGGLASALNGAVLEALNVEAGASAHLNPGASLSGASIRTGGVLSGSGALYSGVLTVFSGGVLSGGLLRGGGVDVFYAGATETLSIEAGGTLELVDAQVGAGSTYVAGSLPSPETLSGVTLSAGAVVELVSASVGSGAVMDVLDHGTATYLTATSSGRVAVSAGGIVGGAVIEAGAVVSGPGDIGGTITDAGSILGAVVFGTITVSSGGLLSGGYLRNAGTVLSGLAGANVDALQVLPGASLDILAGATGSALTIFDGGALSAALGANLKTVTVEFGGKATFASGASVSGLSISQGGFVSASGAALTGTLTVFAGGEIFGGVLGSGIDVDYAGAAQVGVSLGSGVTLDLVSAGIAPGKTITAGVVAATEALSGLTLASGAVIELATATVSSGATLDTLAGAVVNGVTILSGGLVSGSGVLAGIISDSGTIDGGQLLGQVTVASGGLVSGGFLRSGESLTLAAGGSAANLDVLAGASLIDDGTATWSGGATLAGALSGTGIVEDLGGALTISSNAPFAGKVVISAGVVTLAGAGGASPIEFSAGTSAAQLIIGAADTPAPGATFSSEILDFSSGEDSIDLAGLAYVAGASATIEGLTLMLTDGGATYDFALGGSLAASCVVTRDGTGTLITADPPTHAAAAQLVQAMATFGASSEAARVLDVSSFAPWHGALIAMPAVRLARG